MFFQLNKNLLKKVLFDNIKKFSSKREIKNTEINKIRNIGILAHIDAGKTTTTERMLFYSGSISHMGEVHHGNTVTDFMVQERERGITIAAATVTFFWRNHQFNLIDTPGHIDFTMEVEQSLNVLDGLIFILDASAGVEAQTLTVWRQAVRYKLPKLIFLNKMDRSDANIKMCLNSIEKKLGIEPLCLQIPIKENGKLTGLIDILTMKKMMFASSEMKQTALTESERSDEILKLRSNIVDKLSEFNEKLADIIIAKDSIDTIDTTDIVDAIKEETEKQTIVPVLMGSAYKNIGVQPLMDSVILYLPSPLIQSEHFQYFEDDFCAKVFKIMHSKQRGSLVYLRLYNGYLKKGQKVYSVTQNKNEQVSRLYTAFADDLQEVERIENGNIGVVTGMKHTRMGDFLSNSSSATKQAKEKFLKSKKLKSSEDLFRLEVKIPEPVFFCSIEPQSNSFQAALENALAEIQREDPSLSVTNDYETGQIILGGMGELHLEIIKERILTDYKIEVDLGQLQINYHEELINDAKDTLEFNTKIGDSEQKFTITLSLIPKENVEEILCFDKTPDAAKNIAAIHHKHISAIKNGIDVALNHGPRLSCKVSNVQVMLHYLWVGKRTSETVISAGTTKLIQKMVQEIGTHILEPIMKVEIVTPEDYMSTVMADLSRRRSIIEDISLRGNTKVIQSLIPLAELMGYSTILRTISSGTATFSMKFQNYNRMSSSEEEKTITSIRGF